MKRGFLHYLKFAYLGMGIWQTLGMVITAIFTDMPLLFLFLQALLLMVPLVIPSLIIAAILHYWDKKNDRG